MSPDPMASSLRAAPAPVLPTAHRPRPEPPRRTTSGDEDGDRASLSKYLDQLRRHPIMSAEVEYERATAICRARQQIWEALLSYPPTAVTLLEAARDQLPPGSVSAHEVTRLEQAARAVRGRPNRRHRDAFEATLGALAKALCDLDRDRVVSDALAEAVLVGRSTLNVVLRLPPRGSRPFAEYAERITAARATFAAERNAFARANLRLVVKLALRHQTPLVALPDLVQEGNLGLMVAIDRFEPERGFRFSTYATWWIRHAIVRAIQNKGRTVRIPAHLSQTDVKLRGAARMLEAKGQRVAGDDELAAATGLPEDQIAWTRHAMSYRTISLSTPMGDDERVLGDTLPDPGASAAFSSIDADDVTERLRSALVGLKPIERDILHKRFGLDESCEVTLKDLGREHSLSRERIRQLQNGALSKLREALGREGICTAP